MKTISLIPIDFGDLKKGDYLFPVNHISNYIYKVTSISVKMIRVIECNYNGIPVRNNTYEYIGINKFYTVNCIILKVNNLEK